MCEGWIEDAKKAYVNALIDRLRLKSAHDDAKGLCERIESLLKYWSGDYDWEKDTILAVVADEYATNEGLADVEGRLDKLEAVDTLSPLNTDEIGTIIAAHLPAPVDLAPVLERLDILAETAVQHRERLTLLEGPQGMTPQETALVEHMQAVVAPEPEAPSTCPPHHWIIASLDPLAPAASVGGTCKRCGVERDDFKPDTPTLREHYAQKNGAARLAPVQERKKIACGACGHHPRSQKHADACRGGARA